jgi:hypothetical protein
MSELIHLHSVVPPIGQTPFGLRRHLDRLVSRIAERRRTPVDFIGAEANIAWRLCEASEDPDTHICRRLFLRPCAEAVTFSFRKSFNQDGLDYHLAVSLGSALAGKEVRPRLGGVAQTTEFHRQRLIYHHGEDAAARLEDAAVNLKALRYNGFEWEAVLTIFASLVLAQPLSDGNSRMANAVLNLALMQAGLSKGPLLLLTPSFLARPAQSFSAWKALGLGDWTEMLEMLSVAVSDNMMMLD